MRQRAQGMRSGDRPSAWQRVAAIVLATVLILQTLMIVVPAAGDASPGGGTLADLARSVGVVESKFVLCGGSGSHSNPGGPAIPDHASDGCFLCQIFGHGLLPPPIAECIIAAPEWRIAGSARRPEQSAPVASPEIAGRPRGPPAAA